MDPLHPNTAIDLKIAKVRACFSWSQEHLYQLYNSASKEDKDILMQHLIRDKASCYEEIRKLLAQKE